MVPGIIAMSSANEAFGRYVSALEAFERQDWSLAWRLASGLCELAPSHGGVHYVAGAAALQLNRSAIAIRFLGDAVRLSPQRIDYAAQYARALSIAGQHKEAVAIADKAITLPAQDGSALSTLGVAYSQAGSHAKAASAFKRAVDAAPRHAGYRFDLATSHVFFGELEDAEREYENCLKLDSTQWRAHLALSQLRTQRPGDNHVDRIRHMLSEHPVDAEAKIYLNLSLAKELEDLGDYVPAFEHYRLGKAAHRARIGPSSGRDAAAFEAIRHVYDALPKQAEDGFESEEPIFVFGMPRSGTTLVDRILSAHTRVASAGELWNFGAILSRTAGAMAPSLPESIARLSPTFSEWGKLGRAYVESASPHSMQVRFSDKLPNNFLYAGFIARALPNAKLVCVRRNPMDTCLSNFRQMFAVGIRDYDYSYDLLDTGRYYLQFERMMSFWNDRIPGRILELRYEQLVDAQAETTRELLRFCELPWQDACLRFQESAAPISTASAVQVRSPLHRGYVNRWRRYGQQMDALRHLLESNGIAID